MRYEGSPYGSNSFFGMAIEFPDIDALRKALSEFGSDLAAKHLAAAMRRASKPAVDALKSRTPVGPTGNLRRAVTVKAIPYYNSGNAVALVGYRAAGKGKTEATGGKVQKGKDRAFHQGFLEFGTARRIVKGRTVKGFVSGGFQRKEHKRRVGGSYVTVKAHPVSVFQVKESNGSIASSWGTLGEFKLIKQRGGRVRTDPGYPSAFFKRSAKGQPLSTGSMPASRPIAMAFQSSVSKVQGNMAKEITEAIAAAGRELAAKTTRGL